MKSLRETLLDLIFQALIRAPSGSIRPKLEKVLVSKEAEKQIKKELFLTVQNSAPPETLFFGTCYGVPLHVDDSIKPALFRFVWADR